MKVLNFLFCDDIRPEIGNKFSLMGLYNEAINFNVSPDQKNQWPKSTRIGIYAQLKFEKGEEDSKIRYIAIVIKQNDKEQTILEAPMHQVQANTEKHGIVIQALFEKFKFDGPGNVEFTLIFKGEDKQELYRVSPSLKMAVQETVIK
ncbi:MAG: hypothetical protein R6V54_00475 [Desulfobacteraceae bacterium]